MATEYLLSIDANLLYGTPDTAPESVVIGSLDEATNVGDVEVPITKEMVDTTTRANSGWGSKTGTLKDATATFEVQAKPTGDSFLSALQSAFLNNYTIPMAFLDRDVSESGANGPLATWEVSELRIMQRLRDVVKYSVSMSLSTFIEWHTTA